MDMKRGVVVRDPLTKDSFCFGKKAHMRTKEQKKRERERDCLFVCGCGKKTTQNLCFIWPTVDLLIVAPISLSLFRTNAIFIFTFTFMETKKVLRPATSG